MSSFLENLYYRKYRINFLVIKPFRLEEYPYSLIRGIFGFQIRKPVCIFRDFEKDEKGEACKSCSRLRNCVYTDIFKISLPESHLLSGKYTKPPVPYIIYPNLESRNKFTIGELFHIELTLIGKAIEYDTFLLQSIQRISEGKGHLFQKLECTGIETMIGDDQKSHLRFDVQAESTNQLKLRFNSPVILKIKEKPATALPFEVLVERLTERLALLSHLYCGAELPDIKSFAKQIATESYIDSFYPVKVEISDGGNKKTPDKDALLGSVAYGGNLGEYMPLIRAGEILHLGAYPNYGLGKYTIDEAYWV